MAHDDNMEPQHELHGASSSSSNDNNKAARTSKQFQFVHDLRVQYERRRHYELAACAIGFLGVLLMLAQNEVLMSDDVATTKRTAVQTLKWVISLSTTVLVVLVVLQYRASGRIARMENVLTPKHARRRCGCSWRIVVLVLEVLVCGFHIPPGVTGDVEIAQFHSYVDRTDNASANCPTNAVYILTQRHNACYLVFTYAVEAFGVFMVLRLYLFVRYVRSASTLYSHWVAFVGSLHDVNAMQPFFHFKALFKLRPLALLVPVTLVNLCLTAAIIRILESPAQAAFESYGKSVWLTAVTLSATGFGDYYPITHIGRAITTLSAMFGGLLLVALIQSLFFGVLELTPAEQRVQHLVACDQWTKATQHAAATLLQTAWRCYDAQRRSDTSKTTATALQYQLFAAMRTMQQLRFDEPIVRLRLDDALVLLTETVVTNVSCMEQLEHDARVRIHAKATQLSLLMTRRLAVANSA